MQTYYDVLGIPRTASAEEIKQAYFAVAQIYHPDKNRSLSPSAQKVAEEKMVIINEANSVLRDPHKRQEYDYKLNQESQAAQQATQAARTAQYDDLQENLRRAESNYAAKKQAYEETVASVRRQRTTPKPPPDPVAYNRQMNQLYFMRLQQEMADLIKTLRQSHPEYERFAKSMKTFSFGFGSLALLVLWGLQAGLALFAPVSVWTYLISFGATIAVLQGAATFFGLTGNPFKLSFLWPAAYRFAAVSLLTWMSGTFLAGLGLENHVFSLIPAGIAFTYSFSLLAELLKKFEFGQLVKRDQNYTTIAEAVKGFQP